MSKEKFYETIAGDFDRIMNMYDTQRRIEVIFGDFLGKENLAKKSLLDAGCGTGWFSKKAFESGAYVTAIDLSVSLVKITTQKVPGVQGIAASIMQLPFPDNHFDYVISSDVIEHTPDPQKATLEMIRVLKPGGKICITTPNKTVWYFSLLIANTLKIRKYQGLENWTYYKDYKKFLKQSGIQILDYKGIHLFPFVFSFLNPLLKKIDSKVDRRFGKLMVNLAAYGVKEIS
jgi:ubiquinone/menaquinone biosynthesis C-methylase UbiE